MNTLGYAILGLLVRRAHSGYEVSARMREPIGYFWTAGHAQIHGTLTRLVEAGLVTFTAEPGPGPHDKKMYRATAAGRDALADWVATPAPTPQPRNELLLKVFSSWAADPAAVVTMLTAEQDRREQVIDRYRALLTMFEADGPPSDVSSQRFADYATVRHGVALEQEYVRWLGWLIGRLQRSGGPPD